MQRLRGAVSEKWGATCLMAQEYTEDFYDGLEDTQIPSARAIVPFLADVLKPEAVVDIGCGRGFWLKTFAQHGAHRVFGLDGPWAPVDKLAIPTENFRSCDLDNAISLKEGFDLAISLEVAEHLPPERAEGFVQDICGLAPAVFFGAAIPGQGGRHHHNEQWPSFWARLFEQQGYQTYDIVRPRFWNNEEVTWWYKQNTALFVKTSIVEEFAALKNYKACKASDLHALVHPELFNQKLRAANPGFGRWLRNGKKAFFKSAGKRSSHRS